MTNGSPQMPEMYAVSVVLANGVGLPTFYLLANVQGIVSEDHAGRIVADMLADLGHADASACVAATSFQAHGA